MERMTARQSRRLRRMQSFHTNRTIVLLAGGCGFGRWRIVCRFSVFNCDAISFMPTSFPICQLTFLITIKDKFATSTCFEFALFMLKRLAITTRFGITGFIFLIYCSHDEAQEEEIRKRGAQEDFDENTFIVPWSAKFSWSEHQTTRLDADAISKKWHCNQIRSTDKLIRDDTTIKKQWFHPWKV